MRTLSPAHDRRRWTGRSERRARFGARLPARPRPALRLRKAPELGVKGALYELVAAAQGARAACEINHAPTREDFDLNVRLRGTDVSGRRRVSLGRPTGRYPTSP